MSMSETQAKKLFDSIGQISDELVREAQSAEGKKQKRAWAKWYAAAACLCLVAASIFAAIRSTGNPILRAEDIWRGAMSLGSGATMDYSIRRFDAGETVITSPVRDERDADVLSVYRSMEPKSSSDNYQLLLTWADRLTRQAEERLGILLTRGQVFSNQTPYDNSKPETNEYSMYSLEMELSFQDAVLKLRCASDGSLTYYWLTGTETLYAVLYPSVSLARDAGDQELRAVAETVAAFVADLTGRNYDAETVRIYRYENEPDSVSLRFCRADLPGTSLSREMMSGYGDLSVRLNLTGGQCRIERISIMEEHYEYIGDYELISLAEAEEYVREGHTFGGVYCLICRAQSDLPALDFSAYDYVQVEYCYQNMGYAVPHYAFYKHLDTADDGESYGVVYVPAVKVKGVEQYLRTLAREHESVLHTAES